MAPAPAPQDDTPQGEAPSGCQLPVIKVWAAGPQPSWGPFEAGRVKKPRFVVILRHQLLFPIMTFALMEMKENSNEGNRGHPTADMVTTGHGRGDRAHPAPWQPHPAHSLGEGTPPGLLVTPRLTYGTRGSLNDGTFRRARALLHRMKNVIPQ